MQRLTCPLIEFGCRRERCAWWDEQAKTCAVITIMRTLQDIKRPLVAADKPASEKD